MIQPITQTTSTGLHVFCNNVLLASLTLKLPNTDYLFSSLAATHFLADYILNNNLAFDQDYNFYLISLNILITSLVDYVWIL